MIIFILRELLRKISLSALKSTDGSKSSNKSLQTSSPDKPFEFADLRNFRVEFCETSSLKSDTLVPVTNWLLANF
jgi:hypothetical protein